MNLPIALFIAVLMPCVLCADDSAAADEKLLAEHGIGTDEKGLREFFRKRTPTSADLVKIEALVKQLGDKSFQKRKQASDALAGWGPAAFDALRRSLKEPDIEIIRRAERCLEEIERPGTALPLAAVHQLDRIKMPACIALLLDYLPNADDETVADAVLVSLRRLSDPKTPDPVLLKALADRSPVRRAAAAHVLGRHPTKAGRAAA